MNSPQFLLAFQVDIPKDVLDEVHQSSGVRVQKSGRGPGSLEPEESAGLDYYVTTGDKLRESKLWSWAAGPLTMQIVDIMHQPFQLDQQPAVAININRLLPGGRYEKHLDSNPLTCLVFIDEADDGQTGLEVAGDTILVSRRPGKAVLFTGFNIPHWVERTTTERVTIPVAFEPVGRPIDGYEPPDRAAVDTYLYDGGE